MHLEYFAQQKLLPLSNLFFAQSPTFLRWAQGHGLAPEAADHPNPEKVKVTRERERERDGRTRKGKEAFQRMEVHLLGGKIF